MAYVWEKERIPDVNRDNRISTDRIKDGTILFFMGFSSQGLFFQKKTTTAQFLVPGTIGLRGFIYIADEISDAV